MNLLFSIGLGSSLEWKSFYIQKVVTGSVYKFIGPSLFVILLLRLITMVLFSFMFIQSAVQSERYDFTVLDSLVEMSIYKLLIFLPTLATILVQVARKIMSLICKHL